MYKRQFCLKVGTLLQKGLVNWINLVSSNPNCVTTILENNVRFILAMVI